LVTVRIDIPLGAHCTFWKEPNGFYMIRVKQPGHGGDHNDCVIYAPEAFFRELATEMVSEGIAGE